MPASGRAVYGVALIGVLLCLFPGILSSQGSIPAYGGCPSPQSAGVRICFPFSGSTMFGGPFIASPFQLIASGTGSRGPVSSMQVWVDGVKVKTANGNIFDAPVTLSSGTHQVTVVEIETTGNFLRAAPFSVSILGFNSNGSAPCPPPRSPGVDVCVPFNGSCHTEGWTTIIASATGARAPVNRMELWVNGVKLANFPGNTINTNMLLNDFTTMTIVEVDSAGGFIKSAPIVVQSC